jgi:hypothetical protein
LPRPIAVGGRRAEPDQVQVNPEIRSPEIGTGDFAR